MERKQFAPIMAMLSATYPRTELKPETANMYYTVLQDLDMDLLKAAVLQIVATSKWFPAASEIRSAAFDLVEQSEGVPDWPQAWEQVLSEMGRVGYYGKPEWTHECIGAAVRAVGGWRLLCHSTNQVADRARFAEVYGMTVSRERDTMRMLPAVREQIAKVAGLLTGSGLKRLEAGE